MNELLPFVLNSAVLLGVALGLYRVKQLEERRREDRREHLDAVAQLTKEIEGLRARYDAHAKMLAVLEFLTKGRGKR
jgi:hypothetical protein